MRIAQRKNSKQYLHTHRHLGTTNVNEKIGKFTLLIHVKKIDRRPSSFISRFDIDTDTRVTRLDEFSPIGWLFTLRIF
jgi:hypothetical protein